MDVFGRLSDLEDQLVERKLEGAGSTAFKKAIVAFANSLPPNRTGVLFIGVEDDGSIRGVENADKLQRKLRTLAEKDCYPPIYVDLLTDQHDGRDVVAAVVSPSDKRPHFTGAAYVRRGSESVAATVEEYEQLLLSQDDKRRYLQDRVNSVWTIECIGKKPGEHHPLTDKRYRASYEGKIHEITPFYVRFEDIGAGLLFTELLEDIRISYDDKRHRPKIVASPANH